MFKAFKSLPVATLFFMALSVGGLSLTGCDVEVQDEGPLEEVVEGDGLEVEVDS